MRTTSKIRAHRKALRLGTAALFAVVTFAAGTSSAWAAEAVDVYSGNSTTQWLSADINGGDCRAEVYLVGSDQNNADAYYSDDNSGGKCEFYVERNYYYNGTWGYWQTIAGPTVLSNGQYRFTGPYTDPAHYRVRVCFTLDAESPLQYTHCTNGV